MLNSVIPAKAGTALTPAEADLLAAYRAAADEAQPTMIRMMQSIAEGSPRQRPALTLVAGWFRPQRSAGFADPFVLVCIAVIALLVWYMVHDVPPVSAAVRAPASVISKTELINYLDPETGCQYLGQRSSNAGITARIAADGKTHLGCKGGSNAKS